MDMGTDEPCDTKSKNQVKIFDGWMVMSLSVNRFTDAPDVCVHVRVQLHQFQDQRDVKGFQGQDIRSVQG